ncbi:MAG: nicotinamide riboside transporter PnuC, partial [Candidatus Egerieousia sp.]|nr:nicotinamide riboside transporter PnuC [Candidatus Egerieousia sp.]
MMNDFIINNLSYIELSASLFGLVYVVFEVLQKNFMWYLWVLTSITFGIVYYYSHIYAYMGLQIYYVAMGIYGIYSWRRAKALAKRAAAQPAAQLAAQPAIGAGAPGNSCELRNSSAATQPGELSSEDADILVVRKMSREVAILSTLFSIIVFFILTYILKCTEDPNPWLDSFCSVISMLATFWLSRQYLQNWYLWIVCNVASTILSLSVAQYYAALLYFIMIG